MPVPSKEDLERAKRAEAARHKRREMWKELKQKNDESRAKLIMSERERDIAKQKSVERVEKHLRTLKIEWIEIRSHSLPPMDSLGRKQRIKSARLEKVLKKVDLSKTMITSPSRRSSNEHVRRRSTLQLKQAAAQELSQEALKLLQQNIVVDLNVVLASISLCLQDVVTARLVNLTSTVRKRAFDMNISATLDGVYVDDHVRLSNTPSFLLRGEPIDVAAKSSTFELPDSSDEEEEVKAFSSLKVKILDVLSPEFATAKADMSVEYNSGKLVWEIDRETIASILRFLAQGLMDVDYEKAKQGQKQLASRVTTSAAKQIDLNTSESTKKDEMKKQDDDDDELLRERTKFDLLLSLDICDVRLLRSDSKEVCNMRLSSMCLALSQQDTSMCVNIKFDSIRVQELKEDRMYVTS